MIHEKIQMTEYGETRFPANSDDI